MWGPLASLSKVQKKKKKHFQADGESKVIKHLFWVFFFNILFDKFINITLATRGVGYNEFTLR